MKVPFLPGGLFNTSFLISLRLRKLYARLLKRFSLINVYFLIRSQLNAIFLDSFRMFSFRAFCAFIFNAAAAAAAAADDDDDDNDDDDDWLSWHISHTHQGYQST